MKYHIIIEGGFTGIPKEYEGEMVVQEETETKLLEEMQQFTDQTNKNLRDGLVYSISIETQNALLSQVFSETKLPPALRDLIHQVKADSTED